MTTWYVARERAHPASWLAALPAPWRGVIIDALRAGLATTLGGHAGRPPEWCLLVVVMARTGQKFHARVFEERLAELERTPGGPYVLINTDIVPVGEEGKRSSRGA